MSDNVLLESLPARQGPPPNDTHQSAGTARAVSPIWQIISQLADLAFSLPDVIERPTRSLLMDREH